ncbi:unnamed protein product [Heterobilharzia americana]|nr:unnamed protein product [Heterobilharzia americana]
MSNKVCEVDLKIEKTSKRQREYIYNLLLNNNSKVITQHINLPKINTNLFNDEGVKKYPNKTMKQSDHEKILSIEQLNKKYDYLKKHSKKPYIPMDALKKTHWIEKYHKNIVNTTDELKKVTDETSTHLFIPIKRKKSTINWITKNVMAAMTSKPGDRLLLKGNKCIVDDIYKHKLGEIPKYLIKHYSNENLLTRQQREQLLNRLKSVWDKNNRIYLELISINDTLKGKAYKLYLEKKLDSLKKDIELIENHQFIYVEAPKEMKQ